MTKQIFDEQRLAIVRRAYAKQMLSISGLGSVGTSRLEEAFAIIPRERFLGPPPWQIGQPHGYLTLDDDDAVLAYQDVRFALSPEHGVNNGSPSLHAKLLHALAIREGDRVVHIGAGTGYYTALIAHLVGKEGQVTAVEFDPKRAKFAEENLADFPNIIVIRDDGAEWPRQATDRIYVNFCAERPARPWIENLTPSDGWTTFPLRRGTPDRKDAQR